MSKKIVIVREADMQASVLYSDMQSASDRRVTKALQAIKEVADEREAFEAQRERKIGGIIQVGQSPDIRFVQALTDNEAVARFILALKVNPRSLIHPESQADGKSSSETSNLKSYNKFRQIAETIFHGTSDLEPVARVFSVCAYHFALNGHELMTREYCKAFLSSYELRNLDQATAQLWNDIDDVRAKQMSGGAETQSGQMVRQLVAMRSAEDVRDGRNKHVRVNPNGLVMQALMMRFGQITPEASA